VFRKNELEEQMLLNLSKKAWTAGLVLRNFQGHSSTNDKVVKELKALADRYDKVSQGCTTSAPCAGVLCQTCVKGKLHKSA